MSRLFLGLDSSTQSLSAILIDLDSRAVVYECSLNFERDLPEFGTQSGVLADADPLVKHSPPLMWVEALDRVFARMRKDGAALGDVLAISGSGQQHGSVYLNPFAKARIENLDPALGLAGNLDGVFSRATSPIWMDSSTSAECEEIRAALGGCAAAAELTGSDIFERFTGPQIRKFFKTEPRAYEETAHIALVSSFLAGLVAGRIAPIDHGDGAGMNLMAIASKTWSPEALAATAPGLAAKLPPLAPTSQVIGPVSPYFAQKYGVNPEAAALAWSGDNPCSVIGLGLVAEGVAAVSLGTSDTFFGVMEKFRCDTRGEGHVFCSPTGDYMTLICFKNGSLAREKVRAEYGLSWDEFNTGLSSTPPGNNGGIMLPWFESEIVPRVAVPGIHRFDLDASDAAANCRAVVEAQMMSMRLHSAWMKADPKRILATGGASENDAILQVMADVLNCSVSRIQVPKSAALGAALNAAHGWLKETGVPVGWTDLLEGFTSAVSDRSVEPRPDAVRVYDELVATYSARERDALESVGSAAAA